MTENVNFCLDHSKYNNQIQKLEEEVEKLWKKWDKIMFLLVGNLVAVIVLLVLNILGQLA